MIKTLQGSKLRKHLLVRLNDLWLTQRIGYRFPWSTWLGVFGLQAPSFRVGWLTQRVRKSCLQAKLAIIPPWPARGVFKPPQEAVWTAEK